MTKTCAKCTRIRWGRKMGHGYGWCNELACRKHCHRPTKEALQHAAEECDQYEEVTPMTLKDALAILARCMHAPVKKLTEAASLVLKEFNRQATTIAWLRGRVAGITSHEQTVRLNACTENSGDDADCSCWAVITAACPACPAQMEYYYTRHVFVCEHCGRRFAVTLSEVEPE